MIRVCRGQRFRFTYKDTSCKHIHEGIEKLDRMGMDLIEGKDPAKFATYQKTYKNTICGRHPIAVLLQVKPAFLPA
jgi:predicted class III extradiol MEMO1 family dioxygenase